MGAELLAWMSVGAMVGAVLGFDNELSAYPLLGLVVLRAGAILDSGIGRKMLLQKCRPDALPSRLALTNFFLKEVKSAPWHTNNCGAK